VKDILIVQTPQVPYNRNSRSIVIVQHNRGSAPLNNRKRKFSETSGRVSEVRSSTTGSEGGDEDIVKVGRA